MTNYEKETIILFNEAEPTAELETYNSRLLRKLDRLAKEHPDEVIVKEGGNSNWGRYVVPKKWVTINASRKVEITDEQREVLRENLRKVREARRINSEAQK